MGPVREFGSGRYLPAPPGLQRSASHVRDRFILIRRGDAPVRRRADFARLQRLWLPGPPAAPAAPHIPCAVRWRAGRRGRAGAGPAGHYWAGHAKGPWTRPGTDRAGLCVWWRRSRLREASTLLAMRTGYGDNHPKPDIIVEVAGIVPVTIGAAHVPSIIVPGTAPHHG